MTIEKNININGKHHKPILLDVFYTKTEKPKNIVIFCHGFKGYKDWGAWNIMAEQFAANNYFFIKFNFSHNGGTVEQPIDFPDLEAFGNNNFLKELDDLESVIQWITNNNKYKLEANSNSISLIGHSRGGGIVAIKASENSKIKKVISWAGVSDFGSKFPNGAILENWKKNNIAYIPNARTKQEMPLYFQFYQNFKAHENRLTIKTAVQNLTIPYLIIHGTEDETINIQEAINQYSWNSNNQFVKIEGGNHSFDSVQPWQENFLPNDLEKVIKHTLQFLMK